MEKNEINDCGNFQNFNKNIKPFDDIIEELNDLNYEEDNASLHKRHLNEKIKVLNEFQTVLKPKIINSDKFENFKVPANKNSRNLINNNKEKNLDKIFHSLSLSNIRIDDKSRNENSNKENNRLSKDHCSSYMNKTFKSTADLFSNMNNLTGDSKITANKKVILSSEDIEFERIKKKKEEMRKLMKLNEKNMEKQKNIRLINYADKENYQIIINNNNYANNTFYSQMLKKKRLNENKENISNNGANNYNIPIICDNKNDKMSNISRTKNAKNLNKNTSCISNNDVEFEIDYITKNMEIACNITNRSKNKETNTKYLYDANNKSPLRFYFEKDSVMNKHVNKIEKNNSRSKSKVAQEKSPMGLSLRKTFEFTKNENLHNTKHSKDIKTFNTTVIGSTYNFENEGVLYNTDCNKNGKRLIKGISAKTFTILNLRKSKIPNINSFESVINS